MFNNAVIIAGGAGLRMMPLTKYVPKPLIEVEEIPLIQYALDFFKKHKVSNVSVTYGHKAPLLLNYLHDKVATLVNTTNKDNAYFLFNTVIKYIDEPVIICPCDLILDIDLVQLYSEYVSLGQPPLCIVPIPAAKDADYIHTEGGAVTEITRNKPSSICASGIQVLNPHKINTLVSPKDNFYHVWMELISNRALHVTQTQPTKWKAFDNLKNIV